MALLQNFNNQGKDEKGRDRIINSIQQKVVWVWSPVRERHSKLWPKQLRSAFA